VRRLRAGAGQKINLVKLFPTLVQHLLPKIKKKLKNDDAINGI
jgi:hypothetical protein